MAAEHDSTQHTHPESVLVPGLASVKGAQTNPSIFGTSVLSLQRGGGYHVRAPTPEMISSGDRRRQALFKGIPTKGGRGGLGGSHKGAAYSNLIFPPPNFGSRFFLGWVGLRAKRPPPPPSYKQSLDGTLQGMD